MKQAPTSSGGFLKTVIIIIVALAILSYFGFDLNKIFNNPAVQGVITFIIQFIKWFIGIAAGLISTLITSLVQAWNQISASAAAVKH